MKSFIAAIAAALSSLGRFVYERVLVAGRWVVRLVSKPGIPMPSPAPMPADQPEQGQQEDEELALIRTVAAHLAADRMPPPELSNRLSEERAEWLAAMTHAMWRSVASADDVALRNHLRNRKAIRGVLIADQDAILAYLKSQLPPLPLEPSTGATLSL